MAGISFYLERAILREIFRNTAWTPPATIYAALYNGDPSHDGSGGTEVSGNGYARVAATFHDVAATGDPGALVNNAFTFPQANPGAWGVVTHVAFFDAVTIGNFLFSIDIAVAKTVGALDTFQSPDSNLSITLTS